MKQMLAVLFAVLFALVASAADVDARPGSCKPPESYAVPVGPDVYVVEVGDTGWWLASDYHYDPTLFERIVKDNPKLNETWRWPKGRTGGDVVLIICPGEPLVGLRKAGLDPARLRGGGTGGPGGVDDLAGIRSRLERANLLPIEPRYTSVDRFLLNYKWLFGLLLTLLVIAGAVALVMLFCMLVAWLAERRVRTPAAAPEPTDLHRVPERVSAPADPALAGPAFVAPEVPRTPELVEREFERIANTAFAQRYPDVPTPVRPRRMGVIERGFISGAGRVHYADGTNHEMTLTRQRAFRALYDMQDGTREHLYSLQVCMNLVTYSGEYLRGFQWEPEPEATRVIVPAPVPVAAASGVTRLATTTQKVSLWLVVRCSADGTLTSSVSGIKPEEGGDVVLAVKVKLPVRMAVTLDDEGQLGAAALGVKIPETAASAEAERAARPF